MEIKYEHSNFQKRIWMQKIKQITQKHKIKKWRSTKIKIKYNYNNNKTILTKFSSYVRKSTISSWKDLFDINSHLSYVLWSSSVNNNFLLTFSSWNEPISLCVAVLISFADGFIGGVDFVIWSQSIAV